MSKRLTKEEFIEKANKIHNNNYDYSLVEYINYETKVKIICIIHGTFEQTPDNHLSGRGCDKCGGSKELNTEIFIKRSKTVHNNKYDYSKTIFSKSTNVVIINCPTHGDFEQLASSHLSGKGCAKCSKNVKLTTQEFINRANDIHKIYDYSLANYINQHTKIKIICEKHGEFEQTPAAHLKQKQGCPKCKISKSEHFINNFLKENNIYFISQYRFKDCIYKQSLPFDFYIPSENMCIEFQGEQHYKIYRFKNKEKAIKKLYQTQRNDAIKKEYCLKNNIKLIEISYKENIKFRLNEIFNLDL